MGLDNYLLRMLSTQSNRLDDDLTWRTRDDTENISFTIQRDPQSNPYTRITFHEFDQSIAVKEVKQGYYNVTIESTNYPWNINW